jgi:hypothetical protein
MDFKVNDFVLVLDENLSGHVKNIVGSTISIETTDGFLLDFEAEELVKDNAKSDFKSGLFSHKSINSVLDEKEIPSRKKSVAVKGKERFKPTMEVDLHINQLVKSPKGMSSHDMLTKQIDTARYKLDWAISKGIQKIVFIHGVGEGVLKIELEYLFGRYNNVKFYDADYKKYGLGATEVYIYQNVKPN